MKSLNKFKEVFENNDLEHETKMVQSRIISTLLEVIEARGYSQADLAELTGLTQPFISALLNNRKNLNMEHIALFQNGLGIILQPPSYLSLTDHKEKFYASSDHVNIDLEIPLAQVQELQSDFNRRKPGKAKKKQ